MATAEGKVRNSGQKRSFGRVKLVSEKRKGLFNRILAGVSLVAVLAGGGIVLAPATSRAGDLSALQTSVVSTDLFLTWIPTEGPALGLTAGQTAALREIQGDFRSRSEEIGRRIQKDAVMLSGEVGKYPIDLHKVKPVLEEISNLRGELTYHAIKSLYRVQTTMNQGQWDKAKAMWSHILAARTVTPSVAPAVKPAPQGKKP
uniref:Uncharacterized protein n=1 Tax=Leptospirillum ferrodiazotrophum TaxID=412449 RepID=C6HYB3_9BACT|nr:MAG: protein of unknown function [Leptospirillum ferrodiazotrophum]